MTLSNNVRKTSWRTCGMIPGMGILCQFAGCEFGTITTSTTLDARDALIQIIRGVIITPLDAFITDSVNEAFGSEEP